MLFRSEAKGYELLGSASLELGKRAEGKTLLQKAVQMDPTLTSAVEKLKKL